jgi:hypothetical protein
MWYAGPGRGQPPRHRRHPPDRPGPAWNPTTERGVGGKDLSSTAQGLWVGGDTDRNGGETRRRIALLPVA